MTATNKPKYIMPRESQEMCRTKWRKVKINEMYKPRLDGDDKQKSPTHLFFHSSIFF